MPTKVDNRVSRAENNVYECLNYGGIFHDGVPTNKDLEFAYDKGNLSGEVSHMRALALAISELADALDDEGKDESPLLAQKNEIPKKTNETERENIVCVLLFIFFGVLIMLMIGAR